MRMLAATALLATVLGVTNLGAGAAAAESCGDLLSAMRQMGLRYKAGLGELKVLQADLVPGGRGQEAVMRSVRRYGQAIRDLRDQRTAILVVYRDLVDQQCRPYDEAGLTQTRDDFRFYSEEEERIHAAARRILGETSSGG